MFTEYEGISGVSLMVGVGSVVFSKITMGVLLTGIIPLR